MKLFDKTMITAISVLIAISFGLLFTSTDVEPDKFSSANLTLSYFTQSIWCILLVLLIRHLRGNKVVRKKNPGVEFELSVWGYVWRGFLVQYLSLFLAVILILLARLEAVPSVQYTLVMAILCYMSSIFLTWLIFSENRKEQAGLILSLFRGY
ncbi:MAG: hypothetical protein KUG78_17115 [Kangiellaceae bacterium]|nr:hypothetical protein [Kangiellaceae bacterium]